MRYIKVSETHGVMRRETVKMQAIDLERLLEQSRGSVHERETLRPGKVKNLEVTT